tara:strand:- start:258 stop:554 length:297 start_codon:yes stop_codon:yes gene_type:complete
MNRLETLGKISQLKAEIDKLTLEHNALREEAVLKGYAVWVFTKNGQLSNKAPDMKWWQEHRKESFSKLCEKTKSPSHPDHSKFWKKPSRNFKPVEYTA